MGIISNLFSVETVFFTFLNYNMSYIEFFGTIFYLASVWLIAKKKMLTWPIGIISVILYAILFYQIQLYSDTIEQIYYLGASIYGWIFWKRNEDELQSEKSFRLSSSKSIGNWIGITVIFTIIMTLFISRIHLLLPTIFPEPASYPFLDAFTTVMSFVAMFLMAQKRIESWIYWIIVDIIGIILYFIKDVKFLSLLYIILLLLAVKGLWDWKNQINEKNDE